MGGNVFLNTARLCEKDYTRVCAAVLDFLRANGVKRFGIPPQIKDKANLIRGKSPDTGGGKRTR